MSPELDVESRAPLKISTSCREASSTAMPRRQAESEYRFLPPGRTAQEPPSDDVSRPTHNPNRSRESATAAPARATPAPFSSIRARPSRDRQRSPRSRRAPSCRSKPPAGHAVAPGARFAVGTERIATSVERAQRRHPHYPPVAATPAQKTADRRRARHCEIAAQGAKTHT